MLLKQTKLPNIQQLLKLQQNYFTPTPKIYQILRNKSHNYLKNKMILCQHKTFCKDSLQGYIV